MTAATAAGTSSLHDSTSEVTKTAFFFDLLKVTLRRLESLFSDFPRSTFKKVNMIIFFFFFLILFFLFESVPYLVSYLCADGFVRPWKLKRTTILIIKRSEKKEKFVI